MSEPIRIVLEQGILDRLVPFLQIGTTLTAFVVAGIALKTLREDRPKLKVTLKLVVGKEDEEILQEMGSKPFIDYVPVEIWVVNEGKRQTSILSFGRVEKDKINKDWPGGVPLPDGEEIINENQSRIWNVQFTQDVVSDAIDFYIRDITGKTWYFGKRKTRKFKRLLNIVVCNVIKEVI